MESIGIYIQGTTAVGVLVLAILTFMGRSTNALREDIDMVRQDIGILREDVTGLRTEMNVKFSEVRTEMNVKFSEVRTEMHSMNTRLSRVVGHLRISDDH